MIRAGWWSNVELDTERINTAIQQSFTSFQQDKKMSGDKQGNILFRDERFNIMGGDYFMADIFHMLSDIHGQGAGGILHHTGTTYGHDLLTLVDSDDPVAQFGQFLGLLAFLGYSLPHVEKDAVIFPSAPTAEEYRKKTYDPQKTCYFLAGMLSGATNKLFPEEKIRFIEDSCRASGDEVCQFTLQSQKHENDE